MTLSPGAERLFLTLIYFAGVKGECFPSQETLLKALKITRKPVLRRYLNELAAHNLVSYKLSHTSKRLSSGKVIPAPQIKYFVVSNKLYFTTTEGSNGMNINFSSREGYPATNDSVPVTIQKNTYKNMEGKTTVFPPGVEQPLRYQKPSKTENPKSLSPYKPLVVAFNQKYATNLFPTFGKQAAAIKKILQSPFYTEADIWNCAEWMKKGWFKDKGFDFSTILSQIGKYKMSHQKDSSPLKGYRRL